VRGVFATPRAILLQFHTTGVIPAVLLGGVIAFLTLRAGQRDHRANIFLRSHTKSLAAPGSDAPS